MLKEDRKDDRVKKQAVEPKQARVAEAKEKEGSCKNNLKAVRENHRKTV